MQVSEPDPASLFEKILCGAAALWALQLRVHREIVDTYEVIWIDKVIPRDGNKDLLLPEGFSWTAPKPTLPKFEIKDVAVGALIGIPTLFLAKLELSTLFDGIWSLKIGDVKTEDYIEMGIRIIPEVGHWEQEFVHRGPQGGYWRDVWIVDVSAHEDEYVVNYGTRVYGHAWKHGSRTVNEIDQREGLKIGSLT